jgi:Surp module
MITNNNSICALLAAESELCTGISRIPHVFADTLPVYLNSALSIPDFISRQGVQMEILMRAKEANNPKFQFLNPDNPYHQIYKQVNQNLIKKYRHGIN